jgi:ribose transport system substrate-binding protein
MMAAALFAGAAIAAQGGAYGVAVPNATNSFYATCVAGVVEGVKEVDPAAVCVVTDAQFDSAKQLDQISDLIQQGVKALILIPIDANSARTGIQEAVAAGIPVFVIDTPANSPEVTCTITANNYSAGEIAGRALVRGLKDKGKIVTITTTGSEAVNQRVAGLKDQIGPDSGIVIVMEEIVQNATTDEALTIMENVLQSVPDVAGVFTTGDVFAIGICAALQANGHAPGEVLVTSVDGTNNAVELIKSGYLLATAAQPAKRMGIDIAKAAFDHLNGRPVEKTVFLPCTEVNKDNVATYVGF